jgi:hypothetical protein
VLCVWCHFRLHALVHAWRFYAAQHWYPTPHDRFLTVLLMVLVTRGQLSIHMSIHSFIQALLLSNWRLIRPCSGAVSVWPVLCCCIHCWRCNLPCGSYCYQYCLPSAGSRDRSLALALLIIRRTRGAHEFPMVWQQLPSCPCRQ